LAQIESGTQPLANDAIEYLRVHGTAAAKPLVWKQLVRWQDQLEASQSGKNEKGGTSSAGSAEQNAQNALVSALTNLLITAQAWVLTPEDSGRLRAVLGTQAGAQLSCGFGCNSPLGIGPGPGTYAIYSQANNAALQNDHPEYMNSTERLRYTINQYRCADMRALKEKILQFPVGSSFEFAYEFSGADRDELKEINAFLWTHGYKVRNFQKWNFLQPVPYVEEVVPPASLASLKVADGTKIKRTWGRIKKGVRADLTVDKLTYAVGEDVPLHIALENVSAAQPVFGEPYRLRPAFGGFSFLGVNVVVQDEDGPLTPRSRSLELNTASRSSGPPLCPPPYPPGVPVRMEKSLDQLGLLPTKPGVYRIVVTWSPYTRTAMPCQAVPDFDPKGPSAKPFVSVTSNPVVLTVTGGAPSVEAEYMGWKNHFSLADTSFGEKTALLDRATHLKWLRLNFTAGLSYETVREELTPEGRFDGWRFATPEELQLFFAHFTGSPTGHSNDRAIERKLQRLLGGPLNDVYNPETQWFRHDSYGFVGDPVGPDNKMIHYHAGYMTEESGGFNIDPDSGGSFMPGVASSGWGSFLVRGE